MCYCQHDSMDIIKLLPEDLQRHIFQVYIDVYSDYEERIFLGVPPSKIDMRTYEHKLASCLQKPRRRHVPGPGDCYEVVLRRSVPRGGLPMLGKLRCYIIGRDVNADVVTTTVHNA